MSHIICPHCMESLNQDWLIKAAGSVRGSIRTDEKSRTAAENGKKGGRPRENFGWLKIDGREFLVRDGYSLSDNILEVKLRTDEETLHLPLHEPIRLVLSLTDIAEYEGDGIPRQILPWARERVPITGIQFELPRPLVKSKAFTDMDFCAKCSYNLTVGSSPLCSKCELSQA